MSAGNIDDALASIADPNQRALLASAIARAQENSSSNGEGTKVLSFPNVMTVADSISSDNAGSGSINIVTGDQVVMTSNQEHLEFVRVPVSSEIVVQEQSEVPKDQEATPVRAGTSQKRKAALSDMNPYEVAKEVVVSVLGHSEDLEKYPCRAKYSKCIFLQY